MSDQPYTTISKLFRKRETIERNKAEADAALDLLESAGLFPSQAYDVVDRLADTLYSDLVDTDEAMSVAPIEAEGDRFADEQDCGLSEELAARLMARL
jgi:hypothetical protein